MLYFLPLFLMHYCVFVLIPPEGGIQRAVQAAMRPFDENLEVDPYREYLTRDDVWSMADFYKIPETDLHALAARMPDWRGCAGGVDQDELFCLTTCNPNGAWDWYEIGGRFDGRIPGVSGNVIRAGKLAESPRLKVCLPNVLLTPEGAWLEDTGEGTYGNPPEDGDGWLRAIREALKRFPDHRVVCVDIHQ